MFSRGHHPHSMFRFDLKTFFILIAITAVALWCWHSLSQMWLKEFQSVGMTPEYNGIGRLESIRISTSQVPELLSAYRPQRLDFSHSPIMDSEMSKITHMEWVTTVDISNTKLSNACVPYLEQMKGLQVVICRDTQIDETGIQELRLNLKVID